MAYSLPKDFEIYDTNLSLHLTITSEVELISLISSFPSFEKISSHWLHAQNKHFFRSEIINAISVVRSTAPVTTESSMCHTSRVSLILTLSLLNYVFRKDSISFFRTSTILLHLLFLIRKSF